ncbi:shieldin complex subunit 2 [Ranitomeya imitator]|uniref:shieldin complex subunit 2 n=1 Tax=Ranitomeya imitator TaxID=111125 RepID=UPI0037E7D205
MCDRGVIHVFIGSPIIPPPVPYPPPGAGSEWRTAVWEHSRAPSTTQGGGNHGLNGKTNPGESVCGGHRGACEQGDGSGQMMASQEDCSGQMMATQEDGLGQMMASQEDGSGQMMASQEDGLGQMMASQEDGLGQMMASQEDGLGQMMASQEDGLGQMMASQEDGLGQMMASQEDGLGQMMASQGDNSRQNMASYTMGVVSGSAQDLQRPPVKELNVHNDHTREVLGSDDCSMVSAETEFLTVLACSQLAVKSPDNADVIHRAAEESEFTIQDILVGNLTARSASQHGVTCSSELFTDTSDEELEEKSVNSPQSKNDFSDIKGESSAELIHVDYCSSASSKRKQVLCASSPSSEQCKKSKPSVSPVQHTIKPHQQIPAKTLTLLKHCSDKNTKYNIMVVVLQPCHIKEIKVKSGPSIGSALPLATIVVMDQSGVKHNVLMWRTAAFWSLALVPGEIIVLTHLSICEDRWREDTLLQSSFRSKLVNIGSCSTLLSGARSPMVGNAALKELLDYIRTNHYYLRELSPRQPQLLDHIQYVTLAELRPELLVHLLLKVTTIVVLKESTYHFKGMKQNKIILAVEQMKGQTRTLVLWGTCVSWRDQIRRKIDHVWVFKYLFCKKNILSEDLELHTTPWSSCECLFDDDQRAVDFQRRYNVSLTKQMSLLALFEDRYSGEIQVKGSISQIRFHIPGKSIIFIGHETSISEILKFLPDIVYPGCGKCKRELTIDYNNVYEQCYVCLPFNQVRIFYRSAEMNIISDNCCVCVQVPPDILEVVFLNIAPDLLPKCFPSCSDVTYAVIVADLLQSLVAQMGEFFVFTIRSQFMLDENSIPMEKDFHLLDFHLNFEM